MICHKYQGGSSMIEVMVSVAIASISILGMVELQAELQKKHVDGYQRAQAMMLLEGMVDNLVANRSAAQCYAITETSGTPYVGLGNDTTYNCAGIGTASTRAVADRDLALWDSLLKGSAESVNGENTGAMEGARGCIKFDSAAETYTLSIAWQGLKATVVNADNCASSSSYSTVASRRVVSTTVRIADWD